MNQTFENMARDDGGNRIEEDRATRAVEQRTAKLPSIGFLGVAIGAMAVSGALVMTGRKGIGNFIGQWAPTLLIMGVYNKLVKVEHELQRSGRFR